MVIKTGDTVPTGSFVYVPWTPEQDSLAACGKPETFTTDAWKGKKVLVVSVPGAFTPTCHVRHLPPFVEKYDHFKAKGVDVIAVIAANDAFVMSAWGRVNGVQDKILMLADNYAKWSSELGLIADFTNHGLGVRTARFAMVLEDLRVTYLSVEGSPGEVTGSGADAVLAKL